MGTWFYTIIWSNIKKYCKKAITNFKVFAQNANTLSILKTKTNIVWKEKNKIFTTYFSGMTMHVVFSQKTNLWVWQIGNAEYFERGQSLSFEEAKNHVQSICMFYLNWEKNHQELYFSDAIWQSDNNDGYTGSWSDYDFWISPLNTEKNDYLWRYDIYKTNETKSIQSGVTRNLNMARKSCIKIVQMLLETEKKK